ncbi:hypothetical protein PPYR_15614 [Photinus pyralis]|uniref:MADF domain-containing protein n=1 Tax=Photinus pyralis TaxID=7054 RepID=A0A5N3ZYE4_PHOPY|nr:hypothetical protein PPYR_15614 [Photinus pyralis]
MIWNTRCTEYRNREKKQALLREFAIQFSCSAGEIQRKLHNLRNQVSQELKKMKKKKSGAGTDENYTTNWPYFTALKFLIPTLIPNQTESNRSETRSSIETQPVKEVSDTRSFLIFVFIMIINIYKLKYILLNMLILPIYFT